MSKEKSDWLKKISEAIDKDFADPNGYWNTLKKKKELNKKRFNKFDEYLEKIDFDVLMKRLIDEHGDDYRGNCYEQGYMPHPNRKLGFIFNYLRSKLDPIQTPEWIGDDFPTSTYFFKGYYFCTTHGQGTIHYVYDANKDLIIDV